MRTLDGAALRAGRSDRLLGAAAGAARHPAMDGDAGTLAARCGIRGSAPRRAASASFATCTRRIAASCAVSGCHDMGITSNHWTDYTTADKTHTRWVNGPGFDFCIDGRRWASTRQRVIVVPGDPAGSYLVTKIAPPTDAPCQDPTHHRRMPPAPLEPLTPACHRHDRAVDQRRRAPELRARIEAATTAEDRRGRPSYHRRLMSPDEPTEFTTRFRLTRADTPRGPLVSGPRLVGLVGRGRAAHARLRDLGRRWVRQVASPLWSFPPRRS